MFYIPSLHHCTGSFEEYMSWKMQITVYGESAICRLFYSEFLQNWLHGFSSAFPYQLPSFLNNFRRNQFRINWPVLLWFQAMRIVWVGTRKCLIKNGFVQNFHGEIVLSFLSIVRCISCRWRIIYSEWLQDHLCGFQRNDGY